MTDFADAMNQIRNSPGTPSGDLPGIAEGIMRLAAGFPRDWKPPAYCAEAVSLSRSSLWTAADWQEAIDLCNRHPRHDELFRVITQIADNGTNPAVAARNIMLMIEPELLGG